MQAETHYSLEPSLLSAAEDNQSHPILCQNPCHPPLSKSPLTCVNFLQAQTLQLPSRESHYKFIGHSCSLFYEEKLTTSIPCFGILTHEKCHLEVCLDHLYQYNSA